MNLKPRLDISLGADTLPSGSDFLFPDMRAISSHLFCFYFLLITLLRTAALSVRGYEHAGAILPTNVQYQSLIYQSADAEALKELVERPEKRNSN